MGGQIGSYLSAVSGWAIDIRPRSRSAGTEFDDQVQTFPLAAVLNLQGPCPCLFSVPYSHPQPLQGPEGSQGQAAGVP